MSRLQRRGDSRVYIDTTILLVFARSKLIGQAWLGMSSHENAL
jgi:hypothetical protein